MCEVVKHGLIDDPELLALGLLLDGSVHSIPENSEPRIYRLATLSVNQVEDRA